MLLRASLAVATSLALGAAPLAHAIPDRTPAPAVRTAETTAARQLPSPGTSRTYAEREQRDSQAAEFEGGNTVIIGVSGGTILVLLLLVLLVA